MIVRPRPHWLRMLFVWRGSVLGRILPQLGATTALAIAVTCSHGTLFAFKIGLTAVPFTLVGVALAIFLGFRNTVSYDRFWEARKLWGAMLIESRALTRQILTLTMAEPAAQTRFVHGLIACVHALRHQLRGSAPDADCARLLPPEWLERLRGARFPPAMILLLLAEELRHIRQRAQLELVLIPATERHLDGLNEAIGGCERISSTPIPFAYPLILHRTVYLYSFLLPFGLVDSIGAMTPVIVAFISYSFFALEALAEELEEPFGTAPNDLALDAMSRTIEISLREMLGESPLPEPLVATNYVLN